MREGQKKWTREESIQALSLYHKIPFGKMDKGNPEVIALAEQISRTPSAVAYKLVNFASLDPEEKKRGIRGAGHTSKLDVEIWSEFYERWEDLAIEEATITCTQEGKSLEALVGDEEFPEGTNKLAFVKQRVNQGFFRSMVLANYDYRCCITGTSLPEMLIAGHIIPWAKSKKHRLNPRNGLCLNPFHDRAFEKGLIGITPDYRVVVSSQLAGMECNPETKDFLKASDGGFIHLPERYPPSNELLQKHLENVFLG